MEFLWWHTILITVIPAVLSSITTHIFNKKKFNEEVNKIRGENTGLKNANEQLMLETYKISFESLKNELADINKRFGEYRDNSNNRDESYKKRIEILESENKDKDSKILLLEKKIDSILKEMQSINGNSINNKQNTG